MEIRGGMRALGKIIAITNQKGGVGKTTTAINLSACLTAAGKKVVLIDMDPQGNATSGLGQSGEGRTSVYDVIIGGEKLDDAIIGTGFDGLLLAPSSMALAGAEIELVDLPNRERRMKAAIAEIADEYDYIMIDCPPSLSLLTINALTAADSMLIPIQCEYFALEGVGQLMNTLQLVKKKLNLELEIEGIVLTMYDGRTNLGAQVMEEVKKHFKDLVFPTAIPRNVRLSEAPSHGEPIHIYDPRCAGALAYAALALSLMARNGG